jgi:acetaldehyde dehydrogenase/alcohol dehydrogenase
MEKVERLIQRIEALKQTLEMPTCLKDAGVPEVDFLKRLDELAEAAFDDQCTGANPRYPLISEIRKLLLTAYHGAPASAAPNRS